MKTITTAGFELSELLNTFRQIVREEINQKPKNESSENKLVDIEAAAAFLGYEVQTVYHKVNKRELPHFKRSGRLYFKLSDLQTWVENGKRKIANEIG
ncbi:helix-turn-helix domain-containing protein [Emticicia sp.]|uniref:helix-turn-helix domain-containing protein n=1 Tax=Emticicia sp. TaxID=1930953 RepID=UPI003753164C